MKTLVLVLLCFFATDAFASSADSGKCPWKMPFTIRIHATGTLHKTAVDIFQKSGIQKDTNYGFSPSTEDFEFTIDTSPSFFQYVSTHFNGHLNYSLRTDTFRYSYGYDDSGAFPGERMSILIAFAPGADSILSLICSKTDSGIGTYILEDVKSYAFNISGASFDDTSIFAPDPSFLQHLIVSTESQLQLSFVSALPNDYFHYAYNDFTASSVTLSGIFRPTTFSDPASVAEAPRPNNLAIHSSNGSIACSFDVSGHARNLEIFSPLGIKVASLSIPLNQQDATLPRLQAGFYFIRLDSSVAKIVIAE